MRRSSITRERREKQAMLRLVLGPDQVPFVDLLGKAPGRGTYVEADRAILEEAFSPKGAGRLWKGQAAQLTKEQIEQVVAGTIARLEERILELLSLARRAGVLEIGMEATLRLAALGDGGTAVVVAKDISERSEEQVQGAAGPNNIAIIKAGTKMAIGARLGREEVGVVGIAPSVLSERIRIEGARLLGLTTCESTSTNAVERGRVRRRPEGAVSRQSGDND